VIPNEFQPIARKNIGMTAGIETTIPPATWVEGCNRMDMTIFTSEFSRQGFTDVEFDKLDTKTKQKTGVLKLEKPTEVLFEGADTDVYKKVSEFSNTITKEFEQIKEDFCFLFVGHWLQGNIGEDRKDIGMLLRVFYNMFKGQPKKPALIIKSSGANFSIIDRNEILKKIDMVKKAVGSDDLPNVYLLHGELTDNEMNELYNYPKVKAHISFTHGEGFGRPLLEASLSGKPVIAPLSTGQADFLTKDTAVEIPHTMTKVSPNAFPKDYTTPESLWSTVNYNVAGRIMLDIFNNYSKYEIKGKKAALINSGTFSYQEMKTKLEKIIDEQLSSLPQKVALKLPTLTKEPTKLKLPKLKKG